MNYASFGGLLKDFRLRKNLSQKEVAYALGWTEASRLSRIEQGKVANPPRDFIDRLCTIMKLEEEEKNQLLLAGNYLPTDKEIADIKKEISPILQQWPYPAVLIDFSWRIIEESEKFKKIYFLEGKARSYEYILENLFDQNFPQNKYLKGDEFKQWQNELIRVVAHYQYQQKTRTKEDWYTKHIKKMMNNSLFKQIWQKALVTKNIDIIDNFGYQSVVISKDKTKRYNYYFFILPLFKDPRFDVELYMPAA